MKCRNGAHKEHTEARCHVYPPEVSDKAPTAFRIYFTFRIENKVAISFPLKRNDQAGSLTFALNTVPEIPTLHRLLFIVWAN